MPRISADSTVRRRLFAIDDASEEAKIDNFTNVLQESILRDRVEKSKKWNFDFANELPLEGTYDWYKCSDASDWIGVTKIKEEDITEQDSILLMKMENEVTPKVKDTKMPLIRNSLKRRLNLVADKAIRRKIAFD
ncbi:uncharacterized protein LOC119837499 [Zerene cesonia]|uniref:uncharacterized protein LOC119837499 n=1 Tax=Zerene cesonia TaxID=33412 RepID=UPI0018E4E71A|nr:uncharacterized protein LOC119837499 [Zerene cesonia]XP_038219027.1 uncharacterized protein LOC119837499 [Zerene cesonia]